MNFEQIENELARIKNHIRLLNNSFVSENFPVESLIIEMDWNKNDINAVHAIFERYDAMIRDNQAFNRLEFEAAFQKELNIGYQTLKQIVIAFYRNNQWQDVCLSYVKSHGTTIPSEFKTIMKTL